MSHSVTVTPFSERARDTGYSRRHGCGSPGMLHSRTKVCPALSEVR